MIPTVAQVKKWNVEEFPPGTKKLTTGQIKSFIVFNHPGFPTKEDWVQTLDLALNDPERWEDLQLYHENRMAYKRRTGKLPPPPLPTRPLPKSSRRKRTPPSLPKKPPAALRKKSSKRKSPKRKVSKRKTPKRKVSKRKTPKSKKSKSKSPKRKSPKRTFKRVVSGKTRTIHQGPRGGKYYITKGRKVYIR